MTIRWEDEQNCQRGSVSAVRGRVLPFQSGRILGFSRSGRPHPSRVSKGGVSCLTDGGFLRRGSDLVQDHCCLAGVLDSKEHDWRVIGV